MKIENADQLLELMQQDLRNEYTHMLFYLANSATIRGLHRPELKEWLEEEAESEKGHVQEFSNLLSSFGVTPQVASHNFCTFENPVSIVSQAIELEQSVCINYANRLDLISNFRYNYLSREEPAFAAWTYVELFYEKQLEHSHQDLIELRQWLTSSEEQKLKNQID